MTQPLLDPDFAYDDGNDATEARPAPVAVGPDWLLVNSPAGVRIVSSPDQPRIVEPQPRPAYTPPERFRVELLDRLRELGQAARALEAKQSLEFFGPAGVGKSTLLHHLASRVPLDAFPDGIISLSARHQTLEDLRQALFDAFYRSDPPLKPLTAEIQAYLRAKQALIVLDDVALRQSDLEALLATTPQSPFLLASSEHYPWTTWQTLVVSELPSGDALRLAIRTLSRPPASEERAALEGMCNLLGGQPLLIMQLVAFATTQNVPLTSISRQLTETPSSAAATALVLTGLSEAEQGVLGLLTALAGASLAQEHVAALTGLTHLRSVLASLERRYLIIREEGRVSLMASLQESLVQTLDLNPWIDQSLTHLTTWAERYQHAPDQLLTETEAVLQILQQAARTGRWPQILRLVRPMENAALAGRRWGAWEQLLRWGLQAARHQGDRGAEAWALHQLGTRALCLGEENRAENDLKEALQVRAQLDDEAGVEVSQHNLNFLGREPVRPRPPGLPPLGPPPPSQFEDQLPQRRAPSLPGWILALIALLLILLGIAAAIAFGPGLLPSPMPQPALAGVTNFQVSPGQLSFSPQPVGQQSASKSVVVTNVGSQAGTIGPISLSGENPAAFSARDNCTGVQLAPGGSCTVEVHFNPQTEGGQNALLLITSLGGAPQSVPLYGGQAAAISANPGLLSFGPWLINTSTIPQPVTLSNFGGVGLTVQKLALEGPDAGAFAFAIDQCSGIHLAPGQSCQVNLYLIPNREGEHTASLVITTSPESGIFTIPLTAGGLLPTPTFTPTPTPTATPVGSPTPTPTGFWGYGWLVVPNSLDFGGVEIGASSPAQLVTLTNNGPKALAIKQVAIGGPAARDFTRTADSCAGAILEAGASCSVSLIFSPWEIGQREAHLIIGDNTAPKPPPVALQGIGRPARQALCVEPAPLNFGQQQLNTSSPERIITLRNCGTAPLTIQHLALGGEHPTDFTNRGSKFKCDGVNLPLNAICTAGYRFIPTAAGSRRATLTIKHTAPNMTQEVILEGVGLTN